MTDWNVADLSLDRWVEDLEQVVRVVRPDEPFSLVGICHGAAISAAFAARHPDLVSRLILYGGYALGWSHRGDTERLKKYEAIVELVRTDWASDNPAFRQVFTSRFIPGATPAQIAWFTEYCTRMTSPTNAAALMLARAEVNIIDLLDHIAAPTLVLHACGDAVVPIAQGRLLAAGIRNAEFLELDSNNHILLEHEPAWRHFCSAVLEFLGLETMAARQDPVFATLSRREREILTLLTEGLGNASIAERLAISDKTVRNHTSNLYDKLGVWNRVQAIIFARDHGFVGVPANS